MGKFKTMLLMVMATAVSATAALAQNSGDTVVSAGISSFGLNAEGAYYVDQTYRVRGILMSAPNFEALEDSFENGGTLYEYDASIGGVAALVDYYPSGPNWRVSGGLILSQTEFNGLAALSPDNAFTLDDGTVIETGSASLRTTFEQQIAPVVTVGYDFWYNADWVFSAELGAVYTGGLSLEASSTNATLQAEIASDADILQAQQDAEDVTFLPYIGFTVGYRF